MRILVLACPDPWSLKPCERVVVLGRARADPSHTRGCESVLVLENASLRKNGVVVICDLRGVQRRHIRRVTRYVRVWQTIDSCLPLDIRGMHCCHPTSAFYYLIFPVVKRLASKSIRLRLKLHYGEDSSVLTNLAGFCLTRDRLPTEFERGGRDGGER